MVMSVETVTVSKDEHTRTQKEKPTAMQRRSLAQRVGEVGEGKGDANSSTEGLAMQITISAGPPSPLAQLDPNDGTNGWMNWGQGPVVSAQCPWVDYPLLVGPRNRPQALAPVHQHALERRAWPNAHCGGWGELGEARCYDQSRGSRPP